MSEAEYAPQSPDPALPQPEETPGTSGEGSGENGPSPTPGARQTVVFGGPSEIGTMLNDHSTVGVKVENQVVQLYHSRTTVRRFSCRDARPVPPGWEAESARSFRASEDEVEALVHHLEERRILLLSAERGAGKVRAALYLGARLRGRGACAGGTVVAEALERSVRVDVRHLAARDPEADGRLIVFPNALARADPELLRLFEATDRDGWQQLAGQLRARGAYLVFTADPAEAGGAEARANGVHRSLAPHPADLLDEALEERLAALAETGASAERLAALAGARGWMRDTFRFVPQLHDFLDHYVETEDPAPEPAEAWRRLRTEGGRIFQELDGDFDGWSFAFTLALAQCGGEASGVAWMDVDRLHRHVRQWLRRDLNLRHPDAAPADDAADGDTRMEFSDTPLLKRARVEVDAGGLAQAVRFADGSPPEERWRAMFTRHRRALVTVLPGLRALAERGEAELGTLRVLAARIVGRIGEMDPHRVTLPVAEGWARSAAPHRQAALGALMDGAMSSPSDRYRAACLAHLRGLRHAASADGAPEGMLGAVIAAWSWVGDHDLEAAMRELGAIARGHLVPSLEDADRIGRTLAMLEGAGGPGTAKRSRRAILRDLAAQLHLQLGGRFLDHLVTLQFAVGLLCATRGPVPVLTELRRWIAEGGWETGVLVALVFLREGGIADRLDEAGAEEGGDARRHRLVEALAEGDDAVRQTARFLGDMSEALLTPFAAAAALQRACTRSLQAHLADWARAALPLPEHAAAVRALFQALASTHDGILREPLAALLAGPEFAEDSRMRAFAASISL